MVDSKQALVAGSLIHALLSRTFHSWEYMVWLHPRSCNSAVVAGCHCIANLFYTICNVIVFYNNCFNTHNAADGVPLAGAGKAT